MKYTETLRQTSFLADISLQWTLFSGPDEMMVHFSYQNLHVADTLRSQFTLSPRTDLSIADMPINRLYKTFLLRNLYTFYCRQCFTVSLKFSLILFYFFSQVNGIFRSIKIKIRRDFQSVFTSMVDTFPSCKDYLK